MILVEQGANGHPRIGDFTSDGLSGGLGDAMPHQVKREGPHRPGLAAVGAARVKDNSRAVGTADHTPWREAPQWPAIHE